MPSSVVLGRSEGGESEVVVMGEEAAVTEMSLPPREVWLRRRAVRAAVSFSKVTVALLVVVVSSVVMSMLAILPLGWVSLCMDYS